MLLVDDEAPWLAALSLSLRISAGINHVDQCTDSRKVMPLLRRSVYSLVLLDLNLPFIGGEQLLQQIKEEFPDLPVIVISGMNQVEIAIRCIKSGAEDFFVKTDPRERVASGILKILKHAQTQQENRLLRNSLLQGKRENHPAFAPIITCSPKMLAIFAYLQAIACSREAVLISGESGSGKELIARALHQLCCPESPWVAVNVAGLDDNVFADTLFGHQRGAYTSAEQERGGMIEQAQDGILFLDEIGDLSGSAQIKLLRLLQEGEDYPLGSDKPRKIRARILVATNQNLQKKEAAGLFRRDLLYRVWAHRIEIPPLCERQEDIPLLLSHFLHQAAKEQGKSVPTPPPELEALLKTHSFPGNVRELRALVYNAVSLHQKGVLSTASFRANLPGQPETLATEVTPAVQFGSRLPTLRQVSRLLETEALKRAGGNQTIAAQMLGISHQALSKRLKNSN
jgi:DNA-binding NtrC family response regulator